MPQRLKRVGGSYAPTLDSAKLSAYRALINRFAPPEMISSLLGLVDMVELFNQTPASTMPSHDHPIGRVEVTGPKGTIVINPQVTPLEDVEIARIDKLVPYAWELDALQKRLDELFATDNVPQTLRTPAYHLLWYARELTLDREPNTMERVQATSTL